MNQIFRYLELSKQAFHQKIDRELKDREQELLLYPIVEELRLEHPGVAARQLYRMVPSMGIGRDRFERICFEQGYKLKREKAFHKTTDSSGVVRFPNLVTGREFNTTNQCWSSDITYYRISEFFYYLTFILDIYSRMIVGYHVSKRLLTGETTVPALQMALNMRQPGRGLIFHSDGGGQYYCKEFLELTHRYQISNSMCDSVYENAHAERINGTIKNQYLKGYGPQNFEELKTMTKRAVDNYNLKRPHLSLKNLSPAEFEKRMPADSPSVLNDDFCNARKTSAQQQKNHHLSPRKLNTEQGVEKTVNVF